MLDLSSTAAVTALTLGHSQVLRGMDLYAGAGGLGYIDLVKRE